MPDLNANDLEAAKLQVAGTARSMGITSSTDRQPDSTQHRSHTDDLAGSTSPGRRADTEGATHGARARSTRDATKRYDREQLHTPGRGDRHW